MISGAHAVIYSRDAEADRAFLRDVLRLMGEDIAAFAAEMARARIECSEITEAGWGRLLRITLPGGGKLGVHQPRHRRPAPT